MSAKSLSIACCLAVLLAVIPATGQTDDSSTKTTANAPALALVILYDGSGSMLDKVPNVRGELTPKYQLANNAVITIAKKVGDYCASRHVKVEAGLVYFQAAKVKVGIPFQEFDARPFLAWAKGFNAPQGGTPLGEGIKQANKMLADSKAAKKHILIVTDGESNQGTPPQNVIRKMKSDQDATSIYFVAFDVSAKVFDPVKSLGVTVVSAANEPELTTQIDALLGKKILLEAE